eukprot:m.99036 g.99036  ORF g.99036 m.99036 type:complete len:122 (-) comp13660_c0_seq2:4570-4935(-)
MIMEEAIESNNVNAVRDLLRHSSADDPNEEGLTPLHIACKLGANTDILELLINTGASVHSLTPHGFTAMHFAVERGLLRNVDFLLGLSASADAKSNKGVTPLDVAATCYSQIPSSHFSSQG